MIGKTPAEELVEKIAEQEKKAKDSRRLRRIPIDPRLIFRLFETGEKVFAVEGVPEDTQYLGTTFDAPTMTWQMFVQHESFDVVPENRQVPELFITIKMSPKD